MSDRSIRQRLAAILAADVAGYSRLMAVDERATVAALDAARNIFRIAIESNQGRVIDMAGDSVLAVFETASGAVTAALAIQKDVNALAETDVEDRRMRFRIGVHLGDVIEKLDGTIYGDGVNIAARLEGLAEPGGITISNSVRIAVKGKVPADYEDQGVQTVKNLPDPVHAYRVWADGAATIVPAPAAKTSLIAGAIDLTLPDKPSIAVLPFVNMSGDPDQEYFTDGVTEDIITELSRFHSLFVIARNSSFTYKETATDVRVVAKELGVRYVLEGSIRKAANRIRVTGQLIDALVGNHIWAEKYDRILEDVFAVQEELAHRIVTAIAPHIETAEWEKVFRRRPENLGAYEIAVRASANAWEAYVKSDPLLCNEAANRATDALAIDPRSTLALFAYALTRYQILATGTTTDSRLTWREGMDAANKLIEVDPTESRGYAIKGTLQAYAPSRDQIDAALVSLRRAYDLNPHNMFGLQLLGFVEIIAGNSRKAIEYLQQVLRISPRDASSFIAYHLLSMASCCTREYANGVSYALLGIADAPRYGYLYAYLAVHYVGLRQIAKAKSAIEDARQTAWGFVERGLAGDLIFQKPQDRLRATTFMRIAAGLEDPSAADALR